MVGSRGIKELALRYGKVGCGTALWESEHQRKCEMLEGDMGLDSDCKEPSERRQTSPSGKRRLSGYSKPMHAHLYYS